MIKTIKYYSAATYSFYGFIAAFFISHILFFAVVLSFGFFNDWNPQTPEWLKTGLKGLYVCTYVLTIILAFLRGLERGGRLADDPDPTATRKRVQTQFFISFLAFLSFTIVLVYFI